MNETTTVALESALLDPTRSRRTAKQFNLRSESSARFEKGSTMQLLEKPVRLLQQRIVSLAGGEVLQGAVKGSEIKAEDVSVKISLERINQYLGTSLVVKEVNEILKHLDLAVKKKDTSCLFRSRTTKTLGYPNRSRHYRRSCSGIYGYDQLPSTLPSGETVAGSLSKRNKKLLVKFVQFSEAD